MSALALRRSAILKNPVAEKWTRTGIGLGCIPFIVKPIESLRRLGHGQFLEKNVLKTQASQFRSYITNYKLVTTV